jgi:hypothetical protein
MSMMIWSSPSKTLYIKVITYTFLKKVGVSPIRIYFIPSNISEGRSIKKEPGVTFQLLIYQCIVFDLQTLDTKPLAESNHRHD